MGTLTNREDTDEMPQNVAFHQGLHCLQRQNQSSEKKNYAIFLEMITCDTSIYTVDYSDFIVCSFVDKSIGPKLVKFYDKTASR